jgi:hypothetical protein
MPAVDGNISTFTAVLAALSAFSRCASAFQGSKPGSLFVGACYFAYETVLSCGAGPPPIPAPYAASIACNLAAASEFCFLTIGLRNIGFGSSACCAPKTLAMANFFFGNSGFDFSYTSCVFSFSTSCFCFYMSAFISLSD